MMKNNLYLFYGEEHYLIKKNERELKKTVVDENTELMNYEVFDRKDVAAEQIINAAMTLPFMSEKRMVIVKNSGLFIQGRKNESDILADFLKNTTLETTVLLFMEKEINKTGSLYKAVNKYGTVKEFKTPTDQELVKFVRTYFKSKNININDKSALHLVLSVSKGMENILLEADKLTLYKGDGSEITLKDIDNICTKSLDVRVFELIKAVGQKNTQLALSIYSNLILMKESPIMILSLMIRQFRHILLTKYMERKKYARDEIANALSLRGFVVNEYLNQAKNFSEVVLLKALEDCLNTDVNIKSGKTGDAVAVELIILKYS